MYYIDMDNIHSHANNELLIVKSSDFLNNNYRKVKGVIHECG